MSGAVISQVDVAAAHDGDAELVVTLTFENGGQTSVALDAYASRHLMDACNAENADHLLGRAWVHVRDALEASSNRFATN